MSPSQLNLRVGKGAWRRFDVDGVLIGRDAGCQVVLADSRVSRHHLRLFRTGLGWVLADAGSSYGTFLDGQRLADGPVEVTRLQVRLGDPEDGPLLELAVDQEEFTASRAETRPDAAGFSRGPAPGGRSGVVVQRVGRAADNDLVVGDLLVSRHHARLLRFGPGDYRLLDLGSHNGTYLGNRRISGPEGLVDGDIVTVGNARLVLRGGYLDVVQEPVDLRADGVSVWVPGPLRLLDGVSLRVRPGQLLGVVGPSGAGKSTLLSVLTGTRVPAEGRATVGGRDVAAHREELGSVLGYVPQQDVVHGALSVRAVLGYAAELRFGPDVGADERTARVEEVIGELGLREARDRRVSRLSGGQRKRVNVALELLTGPHVLLLDEPTSGLDPGNDKSLMQLLRRLADAGRAVLVVTHNVANLDLCDNVLFLAPGGRVAFQGPPTAALGFFGTSDYADVFASLDRGQPPQHPAAAPPPSRPTAPAPSLGTRLRACTAVDHRQLAVLTRRYVSIMTADRRNLTILLVQAPLLGLLARTLLGAGGLAVGVGPNQQARRALLVLTLSITWLGAANAVREIVKERTIYQRERAFALSPMTYLLSKVGVLAGLTAVQAVLLVSVTLVGSPGPGPGVIFPVPGVELVGDVFLTGLAALALGLLISASVGNADKALSLLPLLLVPQLVLSGGLLPLRDNQTLHVLSTVASARWGLSAAASTVDLPAVEAGQAGEAVQSPPVPHDGTWTHSPGIWLLDVTMLVLLTGVFLFGAVVNLCRRPKE